MASTTGDTVISKADYADRIHLGQIMRYPSEHHPHLVGVGSVGLRRHRAPVWLRTDRERVVLDRDRFHGGSQADLDIVGDGDVPVWASARRKPPQNRFFG